MNHDSQRTIAAAIPVLLSALAAGCGPATVPLDTALSLSRDGADALRETLRPGKRVLLGGAPKCTTPVASDFEGLSVPSPQTIGKMPFGKGPSLWTVESARARLDGKRGFIGVKLVDREGKQTTWARFDMGAPLACIVPAGDAVDEARSFAGKTVTFTPWKASCKRIEAGGAAAGSTLLEDSAGALPVGEIVDHVGGEPWIALSRGTLRVPFTVLRSCFTEVQKGEPAAPSALELMHTDAGRCVSDRDGDKEHVACHSTVGVWEGHLPDGGDLSIRLVRRTLGPIHVTGGRLVDGRRYARTVVSIATGRARDPRTRELYRSIEAAIAGTISRDGGDLRVAATSDPAVAYRLQAEVTNLEIGELQRSRVEATSEYKDGEKDVPNPEHERAREAVQQAKEGVEEAQRQYERDVEEHARDKELAASAKQTCLQGCDLAKDAQARAICRTGCNAGGAIGGALLRPPTRDGIERAKGALRDAARTLEGTPATVKEPIMRTWQYHKTLYSRSVTASIRLVVDPKGGAPMIFPMERALTWSDEEVEADPRHNVRGHLPNRGPIDRPDSLVPWIGEKVSEALAEKLKVALEEAELGSAKKALGDEQRKPGFEAVDAKALDMVGARLRKAAHRGRANLRSATAFTLPSEAVPLAEGECLLAVAVFDKPATGANLTLASADGRFADKREKGYAAVEACDGELLRGDTVSLAVESAAGGEIRWGLYRTSRKPQRGR